MAGVRAWGRLPIESKTTETLQRSTLQAQIQKSASGLAHGMGRSYGDVCLNPRGTLWQTRALDRFINFNGSTGRLICEAGVLLKTIQEICIPQGWILPVTPGTQLITVGGAIANDVHGKNHHVEGTFGQHLVHLTLLRTSGEILECSLQKNADWLAATIGGMGLTGVIVQVELQLKPIKNAYLETETLAYHSLDEFFQLADQSEQDWEHTVSWVDCLSGAQTRGIFMRARASQKQGNLVRRAGKLPLAMPITPPISLVNRLSLRAFNAAYFNLQSRKVGLTIQHYAAYSYPLDHIAHWNRLYGAKGFYQYQSVIPRAVGQDAIAEMLESIRASGDGSFLAVLKTFGKVSARGLMSFPQEGVTLTLDFPNRGQETEVLFQRLDAIVSTAQGRIYPAKDARVPKALFQRGYPNLNQFLAYRDPKIHSGLAQRLLDA